MTPDALFDFLATAVVPSSAVEPSALLRFAGRLHPAVVHFPIALLLTAGLIEILRRFRGATGISPVAFPLVVLGALAAALAAWLGWMNADLEPQSRAATQLLWWHRWIGVSVAGLAFVAVASGLLVRVIERHRTRNLYRGVLVLVMLLVATGGYLGGEIVHGQGHLLEVFRTRSGEPGSTDPAPTDAPPAPPDTTVAKTATPGGESLSPTGHAAVQAIFDARCVKCHGPDKKKAGLRLDAPEWYLGGDPAFAVITPGDAEDSVLFQRISLPADDLDRMPKRDEALAASQIETVRAWIDGGASVAPAAPGVAAATPAPAGASVPAKDPATAVPAPKSIPVPPVDPIDVEIVDAAAQERALEALRKRGAVAGRVAADTDAVDVNLSVLGRNAADVDLALLAGLEPSLTWLNLARTSVTDDGLARLAPFRALRRLRLEQCPVGDAGMAHLAGLPRLEYLNLYGTEITDEGLARLTTLPALKKLYLWNTRVTDEGVAGARAVRPDLEVVRGAVTPVVPDAGEDAPTSEVELPPCCAQARAGGRECDHECCVEAAKQGLVCAKCAAVK